MPIRTVAILGGTGFIGTHLASALAQERYRIKVPTRARERHKHLIVLPTLELSVLDIHDISALTKHLTGCDAVINLVGILNEKDDDGSGFRRAHVELTENAVAACRALGIKRYLHMSALNAATNAPSYYLRTKAEAEDLAHAAGGPEFHVTSFRPSLVFGAGDSFINRFARLLRLMPLAFPLACATARFAPVYVGNVVAAMQEALDDPDSYGQRYDLCGPRVYTLEEIVRYTAGMLGLRRWIVPLPDSLSKLQAQVLEYMPGKPFTRDNYRSLQVDSVCTGENGLDALGIVPTPLEAIVPQYLAGEHARGRYQAYRSLARRR